MVLAHVFSICKGVSLFLTFVLGSSAFISSVQASPPVFAGESCANIVFCAFQFTTLYFATASLCVCPCCKAVCTGVMPGPLRVAHAGSIVISALIVSSSVFLILSRFWLVLFVLHDSCSRSGCDSSPVP